MAGLQHDIGHRLRAHEISTLNICSVAVVRTRQNEKLPLVLVHVERQVIGALLTDVGYRSDDRFGRKAEVDRLAAFRVEPTPGLPFLSDRNQSIAAVPLENLAGRSRRHYLPPNFYGFMPQALPPPGRMRRRVFRRA
jgi:hypothetical protein